MDFVKKHLRRNLKICLAAAVFAVGSFASASGAKAATPVYYSVGQSAADLKTGAPTVTISSGTATFSTAQTGNIGVGDRITYNTTEKAYISGKVSQTVWSVVTATGAIPADVAGATVNSITREYTSLSAAVTGATDANHLNSADLVAGNYQLNIPCYYDTGADTTTVTVNGYTTGVSNYIKIYTPNNTSTEANNSQRHQGAWNDGKYRLQVSGNGISVNDDHVWIDGLQINNTANDWGVQIANDGTGASGLAEIKVSGNILRYNNPTGANNRGIDIRGAVSGSKAYIWNNVIYGISGNASNLGMYLTDVDFAYYVFNNTVVNEALSGGTGISVSSPAVIAKNNLVYGFGNANTYAGAFASGTDYNATDGTDNIGQGTNNKTSQTFVFADVANKDFHLSPSDTAAKNAGTDLSADANLAFNTDIDGQTRSGTWDIGADEGATAIYYSVGQNTTDHKTGTPTVDIASGTATFSTAQTATNTGVGDKVTYNTSSVAYISAKISTTQWKLITATGATPADVTGQTVNSIAHAFNSLSAAEAGATGASYLNTSDLVAGNYQLNFPLYYDTGADTTAVTVDGYATGASNYIKIYTPYSTSTEVNQSQRHQGKAGTGYRMFGPGNVPPITISDNYVRVEGLEVENQTSGGGAFMSTHGLIRINGVTAPNDSDIRIVKNIVHRTTSLYNAGIAISTDAAVKIYDNLIYDIHATGIYTPSPASSNKIFIYNNVIYKTNQYNDPTWRAGLTLNISGNAVVKNNIIVGSPYHDVLNPNYAAAGSGYNITSDATAPGANSKTNTMPAFADLANYDLHLDPNDTAAKNAGTDLSADTNFAFSTDIDGQTRSGSWDIGADEGATAVYYSVGQNTSDHKTGSPTVDITSGTATFSVAQTATNLGVGDKVTYNTTSVAYISQKISQTQWKLITATGGTPADVIGQTVNSIAHAFNSLSAAEAGATGASYLNTADLVAGNYQLNFPCYYDSGADTTAVTVDGYATGTSNYIRIYTPSNASTEANQSQRHQGKWDDFKYRLERTTSGTWQRVLSVSDDYVKVDGLQIKLSYGHANAYAVDLGGEGVEVGNTIIQGIATAPNTLGYGIYGGGKNARIYGNAIYGFRDTNSSSGVCASLYYSYGMIGIFAYNNVAYDCHTGYKDASGFSVAFKNNIVQNSVDGFYDTYLSPVSDYNISNLASDAPGANSKNSTTVSFADAANKDFHLSPSDTAAKNAGTNLSADANFAFATDIDGQTRAGNWDIGADEAANNVFYSVGQSASDLKTGTPTVAISSGTATFSTAQTGNIGVGDRVTYNTSSIAYIASKIDQSNWKVVTATGAVPADVAGQTVNSITREFTSLSAAVAGASDASHLNSSDLTAANVVLNIPAYYDSGADTAGVVVSGYATSVPNHIKIYTPSSISAEANNLQRHNGKWDDAKYRLEVSGTGHVLKIAVANAKVEGLQVNAKGLGTYSNGGIVRDFNGKGELAVSRNIIRYTGPVTGANAGGSSGIGFLYTSGTLTAFDNIVYDFKTPAGGGGKSYGINGVNSPNFRAYNNTVYNCDRGAWSGSSGILKNNIAHSSEDGYSSVFNAASNYNISDLASDAPGANSKSGVKVKFADAVNKDFHLAADDVVAKGAGADLSADANFAFATDIDGQTRAGNWDIGADQSPAKVFYSVGQNTNDHKTGAPTLTISGGVGTFSEAQTATNLGVGDKVTYNTSSVAYISEKVSGTQWKLITATGAKPADVAGQTVDSIAHAFNSLSAAEAGAPALLGTSDLVAGNYQLNFPCYYDSGPDTTAVTVDGYTTGVSNYIRIYTPTNVSTETNQSQRHGGKWDDGKYNLSVSTSFDNALYIKEEYVIAEGLQIRLILNSAYTNIAVLRVAETSTAGERVIKNNVVTAVANNGSGSASNIRGIWQPSTDGKYYIYNNLIYGSEVDSAIEQTYGGTSYPYNNTMVGCAKGIYRNSGSVVAMNNIVQSSANGYDGTFNAASDYNISDLVSDAPGANSKNSTTVTFIDSANLDFHLSNTDTAARDAGADLSADANLPFATDIDGQVRPQGGAWDIGADEAGTVTRMNGGVRIDGGVKVEKY